MQELIRDSKYNDMSFLNHRSETVCFTGHRTEKFLDNVFLSEEATLNTIKTLLALMTADAYSRGAKYFITGMARGVDLWAGELLLYMQSFLPDVHIIAAVPHPKHERSFNKRDKELLYRIGNAADAVICVSPQTGNWCYLKRNDYMLANSAAVLGVIHTSKGGTAYTLKKASSFSVKSHIIDVRDYKYLSPLLERYPEIYRLSLPSQRYAFWEKNPRLLYQCGLYKEYSD